jgi:hypothetical protein
MKTANAFIVCLLGLIMASPASATYLQIVPALSGPDLITGDRAEFPVTVVNNGDENAYDVRLSLILPDGFTSSTVFYRQLKPKEQRNDVITLDIANSSMPGTYSAALLTNYADANRYPFSSVNPLLLNYKATTVSRIYGSIGDVNIKQGPENTKLTIINHDDRPHTVKVMPLLPDELKMSLPELEYTLNPNEEKDIPASISSTGALQGSTYTIFAKITYTENNQLYSALVRGVVHMEDTKPQNPTSFPSWLPYAGIAIVIAIIGYKRLNKPRRRK